MRERAPLRLGELERAVLGELWARGACDVKSVHRHVGVSRGIASNTVQSTLDRLHRKGLAERRKVGRAFEYRAALSQREWTTRLLETLLADVPHGAPQLLLAAFVDLAERTGSETLAELERLIAARRREPEG